MKHKKAKGNSFFKLVSHFKKSIYRKVIDDNSDLNVDNYN